MRTLAVVLPLGRGLLACDSSSDYATGGVYTGQATAGPTTDELTLDIPTSGDGDTSAFTASYVLS